MTELYWNKEGHLVPRKARNRAVTEPKEKPPKHSTRWLSPYHACGVRSQNYQRFILKGPLTDRRINQYLKIGRLRKAA